MIDVGTASQLLDFGARISSPQRAQEQLEGAVAIHNMLAEHGVAYLADEVGMGKTYVALGALALFRHFQPDFRVLIVAPRENIQNKWMKEMRNFVAHNVRFPDLRVKGIDGRPSTPLVFCSSLLDLVHEVTIDPNRDFFMRLTSFSLPVTGKDSVAPEAARRLRDGLRGHLPWLRDEIFDLRNKQGFKDNVARAICCALPRFDLVIVDEGHNLKHGFGETVSARNRVLALAMGHPDSHADPKLFPGFGSKAARVLFLSATPVEETYRHLWNQLDIFGRGGRFEGLRQRDPDNEARKKVAGRFLVRRVTAMRIGDREYTKNLYRREWRNGGVHVHDEPIRVEDPRQRLIVALVQKKVSELLGHERFGHRFQIGMLASFESFLETARLKRDEAEASNFDDPDQTDKEVEREGIDVADVNRLARSFRRKFDEEMPHPKMDAVVDSLSDAWVSGRKSLIFVRRIASVKDLKSKLDERYDAWLLGRLKHELPGEIHARLQSEYEKYRLEKRDAESRGGRLDVADEVSRSGSEQDRGGRDTFFAWFFRGEGRRGVISGANIQQRFIQRGATYATFFADNHVADILGCAPGMVETRLGEALGVGREQLRVALQERSGRFLSGARRHARADRFEAVQAAAIEWLKDQPGPYHEKAGIVWREKFQYSEHRSHASEAPDIGNWLELPTFFSALRERDALRQRLWPQSQCAHFAQAFREQELRAQLLASAARLGHGLIDLYIMTIRRLGSLELRAQESSDDDRADTEIARIAEYLDLLEKQMVTPRHERPWGAFDELSDIAANFDLIIDVNEPDARQKPLPETARVFGQMLRQQQPVGGMSGQINQTLVRQFRMPGYPLVLVTTDLLQEGEDLHTFCSSVHHYGIAWTPSSMEQRTGRVDRVCSQTERRLSSVSGTEPSGAELLQVYFPYLEDTVEVLQVQRVLERMNEFIRLMHEDLVLPVREDRSVDANREFARGRIIVPQIRDRLRSAFPVKSEYLGSAAQPLAVDSAAADQLCRRFALIAQGCLPGLDIVWEPQQKQDLLAGTVRMGKRVQPFSLLLRSIDSRASVRCVSPIGRIDVYEEQDAMVDSTRSISARIAAVPTEDEGVYHLTVEGDVLVAKGAETDRERIAMLIGQVVRQADELEQECLPGEDMELSDFLKDLEPEDTDVC